MATNEQASGLRPSDGEAVRATQQPEEFVEDHQFRALVQQKLSSMGFTMMHRGKGQYWIMIDRPFTLAQVSQFALVGLTVGDGKVALNIAYSNLTPTSEGGADE